MQNLNHKKSILNLYRYTLKNIHRLNDRILEDDTRQVVNTLFRKKIVDPITISKYLYDGMTLNELLQSKQYDTIRQMINEKKEYLKNIQLQKESKKQNKEQIDIKKINLLRGKTKSLKLSRIEHPKPAKKSQCKYIVQMYINKLIEKNKIPKNIKLDKLYLESIIIPNLQFELNKLYYNDLINRFNKGPFQSDIKFTFSGVLPLPYIMTPSKFKYGRKALYQHIQKQNLFRRLLNIWESKEGKRLESEHILKDGGYSVLKSFGFGDSQLIYPRYHYEKYTIGEELMELFVDTSLKKGKLKFEEYNWSEYLQISSDWIHENFENLKMFDNVTEKQRKFQNEMNRKYDKDLIKFKQLQESLKESKSFKNQIGFDLGRELNRFGFKSFDLNDPDFDMSKINQKLNAIADKY
ncbi:unnamed protein product [Candida verbasci]|uniref:Uncharacterized protein n=1 Tax=Candida verbasci TaxID=1227364 RepID=A0A9W4U223_9ASCO|nr:unnamed protein product [Candida verbasci]